MDFATLRLRLLNLTPGRSAFAREVSIEADYGGFCIYGRIDFILVFWRNGEPWLRIGEGKASRQNKTQHLFQIAAYRLALRELLHHSPLIIGGQRMDPAHVEGVVVRIDEATGENQSLLNAPALDLSHPIADLEWRLSEAGPLARVEKTPLDTLEYQLDEKCHDCAYSYLCMAESGRQRRLELIGLAPTTTGVLRATGIDTIDALADLDLEGTEARALRANPKFLEYLPALRQRARARRRTLPDGDLDLTAHEVVALSGSGAGQLPLHEIDGQRLTRIFLSIAYDHIEARVACLSAHITDSEGQIETGFCKTDGGRIYPDPHVRESPQGAGVARRDASQRPLSGQYVIEVLPSPWTGAMADDNEIERRLLQRFFLRLASVIQEVAGAERAPIHFYVWERSDMQTLVEACQRCDSALLYHLRQLLGCRERLEQRMLSSLKEEVYNRYATAWTSQTLIAAASLRWYDGRRFHWTRSVGGKSVDFAKIFVQDQHDFRTGLRIHPDRQWADPADMEVGKREFEIRARFHDGLPLPYIYASLGMLPEDNAPGLEKGARAALRRYRLAAQPGYLEAYVQARLEALRWIEEGIKFKNKSIEKRALPLADLTHFDLGAYTPARAARDYMLLEQSAAVEQWLAAILIPPLYRVPKGDCLPVRDVRSLGDNVLEATLDLERYHISAETFKRRCGIGEYVRITPCSDDPAQGQKQNTILYDGATCHMTDLNWEKGTVRMTAVFSRSEDYRLPSRGFSDAGEVFAYATLDTSVCDYTARHVDYRLRGVHGSRHNTWFDPITPSIPPQRPLAASLVTEYRRLLESLGLTDTQIEAVMRGLNTRVSLVQGPPGTGKTRATAAASLLRILARRSVGEIVVVTAMTHTALDKVLADISASQADFAARAQELGFLLPDITISKVFTRKIPEGDSPLAQFTATGCQRAIKKARKNGVLIIGGLPGAALKMARHLEEKRFLTGAPDGFQTPQIIVDEASMMPYAYFFAVASLLSDNGEILLAGDHKQLAPIQARDWKNETRPPTQQYAPFHSAFTFLRSLKIGVPDDRSLLCSGLDFTHRLTPAICRLLAPSYAADGITLTGQRSAPQHGVSTTGGDFWSLPWQAERDLTLFVHDERDSRRYNELEADIAAAVLGTAALPEGSVALLTPHRAQRACLSDRLADYADIGTVATIEKLQGANGRRLSFPQRQASHPPFSPPPNFCSTPTAPSSRSPAQTSAVLSSVQRRS